MSSQAAFGRAKPTVICLMYHEVGDYTGNYAVTRKQLRKQLTNINQRGAVGRGWEIVVSSPNPTPTNPIVLLTVDDGHESSFAAAEEFLAAGATATFFVSRDRSLHDGRYLRPGALRQLRAMGMTLGTHGTSHRHLSYLPARESQRELTEGKAWLEDVLGESVDFMSAPHGSLNSRVIQQAKECGYQLIGTSREAINQWDRMQQTRVVHRVALRSQFSSSVFDHILNQDRSFYWSRQLRSAALALPKRLLARGTDR